MHTRAHTRHKPVHVRFVVNVRKNVKQTSLLFATISSTKAWKFKKFQSYAYKILKNYQKKFCKDPCTHTRARRVFAHARDKTCAHRFTSYELQFQISWRSELRLRRYLQNNNDVCLTFLRTFTTKRACTGLRLVCACVCTDPYETSYGSSLVSYELKFQIS